MTHINMTIHLGYLNPRILRLNYYNEYATSLRDGHTRPEQCHHRNRPVLQAEAIAF